MKYRNNKWTIKDKAIIVKNINIYNENKNILHDILLHSSKRNIYNCLTSINLLTKL